MGKDLAAGSPAARRVLDLADEALGFQLTRLLFEGPSEELQQTMNTQPAVVAVSLAAVAGLREAWSEAGRGDLPLPAFVAGHSVGEYAALVASGAADEATGLRLVLERARLMQRAGEATPGGMVAVIGLRHEAVAEACRQARRQVPGSYVDVANHNAETQVTIAGDPQGLAAASKLCQAAGARRCVTLAVSAAFHSRAMAQAAAPLGAVIAAAAISDARIPLVGNVDARPLTAASELREELAAQVAKPVLWADSLQRMVDAGITAFIEFGHGRVLTSLVERMAGGLAAIAIGDTAGVRAAVDWLPAHLA
jgi:[acyl-carrier-protein] S-malonyltransferase